MKDRSKIWADNNKWFGVNKKLTYQAFDFHKILVEEVKINPKTKKYYQLIDLLMEPFLTQNIKKVSPICLKIRELHWRMYE
tara:strand:- start:300 stop:542 length:243 start_codon:yes stop_codon:yes gene_type:complete